MRRRVYDISAKVKSKWHDKLILMRLSYLSIATIHFMLAPVMAMCSCFSILFIWKDCVELALDAFAIYRKED